jgi:hypothetical protein
VSTSGSTDFNLVTNELIDEAFDLCGIGSEGEAVSADMYERARRSANLLIKTWGAAEHLWTRTERSVALLASTASYALTPKPMRVLSVRRKVTSGGIETPLYEMSRQEYFDTPNKTSEGTPTAFYYDPQTTAGTLYLWPRPSTVVAAAQTLQLTYLRRMDDFDASSDDADLPQEWLQALCYALAAELALKYGVAPDVRAEIGGRANALYAALKGWDNEPASMYLQPDHRWC